MEPSPPQTPATTGKRIILVITLAIITFCVYSNLLKSDFIGHDDPDYITQNLQVLKGLTPDSILWAFTSTSAANWHPLAWLSHLLDISLYGLNPTGHHLTNLLLHMANTVLLYLVLQGMTGAHWRSLAVAALFALHPLHVESVAWISERKDLLAGFFWLLTMAAYRAYLQRSGVARYGLVLLCFACGLMAKPMVVTLPFVLLLLDFWPLGRTGTKAAGGTSITRLLVEKIPLLLLSGASSLITFYAQHKGGAVSPLGELHLAGRVANALTSYVAYLVKMVWPAKLAMYYPLFLPVPTWKIAGAILFLTAVTSGVIYGRHRYPYLLTGWFWYLGTLVPVIGLVQVGTQSMADRYTYLPLIGPFFMLVWGAAELAGDQRQRRTTLAISATVVLTLLALTTWRQTGHWENSLRLFTHAIQVTDNNYLAISSIGNLYHAQGRYLEAEQQHLRALTIRPDWAEARNSLAMTQERLGKKEAARANYAKALQLRPDYGEARFNLAMVLAKDGETDAAIAEFNRVLQLSPNHLDAHYNLAVGYARQGKLPLAMEHFNAVLRIEPTHGEARRNLTICQEVLERGAGRKAP
jgi:tetratricopeptide (TPR) repeat protein